MLLTWRIDVSCLSTNSSAGYFLYNLYGHRLSFAFKSLMKAALFTMTS